MSERPVAEILNGLDVPARERVAVLRAQGRLFWLDVSLAETSSDDVIAALGLPVQVLRALTADSDASVSRAFYVVTVEYLATLHQERVSLPEPCRTGRRGAAGNNVIYPVLDAMLASAFDALDEVELTIDALAATWTDGGRRARPEGDAARVGFHAGDDATLGDG